MSIAPSGITSAVGFHIDIPAEEPKHSATKIASFTSTWPSPFTSQSPHFGGTTSRGKPEALVARREYIENSKTRARIKYLRISVSHSTILVSSDRFMSYGNLTRQDAALKRTPKSKKEPKTGANSGGLI